MLNLSSHFQVRGTYNGTHETEMSLEAPTGGGNGSTFSRNLLLEHYLEKKTMIGHAVYTTSGALNAFGGVWSEKRIRKWDMEIN